MFSDYPSYVRYLSELQKCSRKQRLNRETFEQYKLAVQDSATLCEDLFNAQGRFLGNFTSHGIDHSLRLLGYALDINEMLKNQKLKFKELYLLGLAAFLHDIGMTNEIPSELTESIIQEEFNENNERYWYKVRRQHAAAIAEMLEKYKQNELRNVYKLDGNLFSIFLPNVCKAHSDLHFIESLKTFRDHNDLNNEDLRYSLISAILLLADELDLDKSRAPSERAMFSRCSKVNKAHWWKHMLVEKCYFSGSCFKIVHCSEKAVANSKIFIDWSKAKIESQIQFLKKNLDIYGNSLFKQITIDNQADDSIRCEGNEVIGDDIVEYVMNELTKINGKTYPMKNPRRLVERVGDESNAHGNPSNFFDRVILDHAALFKGQGDLAGTHGVLNTYVWTDKNKDSFDKLERTCEKIINERLMLPSNPVIGQAHKNSKIGSTEGPRNIQVIIGEKGVGKTHFINVFETLFSEKEIAGRNLMIKCECTSTEVKTLQDIKRIILRKMLEALDNLDLYQIIRDHAEEKGCPVPTPTTSDILLLSSDQLDILIKYIGSLIHTDDLKNMALENTRPVPVSMILFLDNTDHLDVNLANETLNWAYNMSPTIITSIVLCLRPTTYNKLRALSSIKEDYKSNLCGQELVIQPPSHEDVLLKRINYLIDNYFSPTKIFKGDIINAFLDILAANELPIAPWIVDKLPQDIRHKLNRLKPDDEKFINAMNTYVICNENFFSKEHFGELCRQSKELNTLVSTVGRSQNDTERLNRLLLELSFPHCFKRSFRQLPSVEIKVNNQTMSVKITTEHIRDSLKNIATNITESSRFLLPSLVGTNIRLLNDVYRSMMSSWVLTSEYFISSSVPAAKNDKYQKKGWKILFEAALLGSGLWYNSETSRIENIFKPQTLLSDSNYFVGLHILQIVGKKTITLTDLKSKCLNLGYTDIHINTLLPWLTLLTMDEIYSHSFEQSHFIYGKQHPFIKVDADDDNRILLKLSEWGDHFLKFILYQSAYWKHITYDCNIPNSLYQQMKGTGSSRDIICKENVLLFIDYLKSREQAFFRNLDRKDIVIEPVMESIESNILQYIDSDI